MAVGPSLGKDSNKTILTPPEHTDASEYGSREWVERQSREVGREWKGRAGGEGMGRVGGVGTEGLEGCWKAQDDAASVFFSLSNTRILYYRPAARALYYRPVKRVYVVVEAVNSANLGLKLVASTVTSFLFLALFLFMVHRLRQRRQLIMMRREAPLSLSNTCSLLSLSDLGVVSHGVRLNIAPFILLVQNWPVCHSFPPSFVHSFPL